MSWRFDAGKIRYPSPPDCQELTIASETKFLLAERTWRSMLILYIDADACPVKDEVYRVARRYSMRVVVVGSQCSITGAR
jgi:hypothetical protein